MQEDFFFIMQNLPVHVPDDDIAEMFAFADKDGDGQLSYEEFEVDVATRRENVQVMVDPGDPGDG